jgi:ligand-binding sensor domain-containing protein/signal transduction histidine kinase
LWLVSSWAGLNAHGNRAPELFLKTWQVEEGLPSSLVTQMVQDGKGYLWLATMEGLVRFDGLNFQRFNDPLISGARARNIRAMVLEDDHTLLLLPAVGGVIRYRDGVFSRHPMSEHFDGKRLDAVFVEHGGAVWVGLVDEGVARWQDGEVQVYGRTEGVNRGNAKVYFAMDRENQVWVATSSYVGSYRDGHLTAHPEVMGFSMVVASSHSGGIWLSSGDKLQKYEDGQITVRSEYSGRRTAAVRELYEDHEGILWLGTAAGGLFCFTGSEFASVPTSHKKINSVMEDHERNLWVTTDGGGINRLRPKAFQVYDSKAGLPEELSDTVSVDREGVVWVSNRSGGMARIKDGLVDMVLPLADLRSNVNIVCADDQNAIWVAAHGLFRYQPSPASLTSMLDPALRVRALFKDREGRIWAGGDRGLLGFFKGEQFTAISPADGYSGQRVRCITQDREGCIWVGTEEGGIYREKDGKFQTFTQQDGLPQFSCRTIYADAEGGVWIASIRAGLLLYRNGKFLQVTQNEGLLSNEILQLLEDDRGRLWCGSTRGIFHVSKQELVNCALGKIDHVNAVMFGQSEGLEGGYCLDNFQPLACKSPDGRLWFTTQRGVVAVNPAILKNNQYPPRVDITEVLVQDRPVPLGGPIRVPPGRKKLEFRFAGLSYAAPEKVRIRHQLEGVDSDWIESGPKRNAIYAGLEPGDYRLLMSACNNDGIWNAKGAVIAFTVLPAWWQTLWFRVLLAVFTGAMVVSSARYWSHRRLRLIEERLAQHQALERERERIARDLHDDVGASIAQLGLVLEEMKGQSDLPEPVKKQSGQISSRVRTLARDLDAVVWTVNPRNDSLPELVSYLSQFFLEFFQRTAVRPRLDVGESISDHLLYPDVRHHLFLTAKEAMNNALKHADATEATLSMTTKDGWFELTLADNGRGFSPDQAASSRRNGLRNMQSRIQEIGGEYQMTTTPGRGTMVRLRIPLAKLGEGEGARKRT